MKDKDRSIERQWAASTVAWYGNKLAITHEMDYPSQIIAVDKMMHELVRSDEQLFGSKWQDNRKRKVLLIGELGRTFLDCLQVDVYAIKEMFPQHKLSPLFLSFLQRR